MAYDWSGNNIKQQRYDWVVIAAFVALALFITVTPLAIILGNPSSGLMETTAITAKPSHLKL